MRALHLYNYRISPLELVCNTSLAKKDRNIQFRSVVIGVICHNVIENRTLESYSAFNHVIYTENYSVLLYMGFLVILCLSMGWYSTPNRVIDGWIKPTSPTGFIFLPTWNTSGRCQYLQKEFLFFSQKKVSPSFHSFVDLHCSTHSTAHNLCELF